MTQAIQNRPLGHYRVKHVVKSEVLKILTLRSTAITVGLTVVAGLLVTGLVANASLHHSARLLQRLRPDPKLADRPDRRRLDRRRVRGVAHHRRVLQRHHPRLVGGHSQAAHPAGGQDRRRRRGHRTVFCELLSFASFFLGQAVLSGGGAPSASLGSPGALRAVVMTGVFIALMALMSFGFGLILRSTAGAIAAFVGVVFVLPLVMHGISEPDLRYVPTNILTNSIMATVNQQGLEGYSNRSRRP